MSLKSFHIIFLLISSLFSIIFSYWCYYQWLQYAESQYLVYLCIGIVLCVSLLFYGKWFIKEIAEIKMLEKNMREQFNDLGGEEWEGPPSFVHISWMEEAFQTNESGWSEFSRHEYSVYMEEIKRREIKNPLPIGSGICYVLSVPENENWSKIGFTTKSAQVRADDYSKQHDLELNVAGIIADENAAALEKILHEEFSSKRVEHGSAKEIFAVPPKECIEKMLYDL